MTNSLLLGLLYSQLENSLIFHLETVTSKVILLWCRPRDRDINVPDGADAEAPTGASGETPSVVDANCKVYVGANHADYCRCGITGGSNDYFNSDHQDDMDHLKVNLRLKVESLNMVEAFAGVGAFGNGWRRLGNRVIGLFEWDEALTDLLIDNNPDATFDLDFYKIDFSE